MSESSRDRPGAQGQVPASLMADPAAALVVGIVQGLVMPSMLSGQPDALPVRAERVFAIFLRRMGGVP